ncbi:hypothetical protein G6011_10342 [Alternaria panax]|uniref:MFS transporter n=1 Tax=Alternaria panax TaxID=48097 RepID=A0AAD4IBQ9_9PLEO|nr:hypothetical protein G6011_10342 [Alternaria panax]
MTSYQAADSISLREPQQLNPGEREISTIDDAEQAVRQRDLDRKRVLALVGSAFLQLPIWGFAMSYGVLQEYYFDNWTLNGGRELTGIVGTTSNGVMYLSMPFLFALFTKRWARYRQSAAISGALLACTGFILSSFSRHVWHLVATQGVLAALGCAIVYSPTTLSLGEWLVKTL